MSDKLSKSLAILLLKLNRKRRLLSRIEGIPANWATPDRSLTEDSALILLDKAPHTVQELAEHVGVEQSWMSRNVARLVKSNSATYKYDSTDKRRRPLYITAHGRRELEAGHTFFKKFSLSLTKELTQTERITLIDLLSELATSQGIGNAPYSTSWAVQLELELDRISRLFGAYASKLSGTQINVSELQALLLATELEIFTARDLDRNLADDQSFFSRLLTRWSKKRLVEVLSPQKDSRTTAFTLTKKGKEYCNKSLVSFQKSVGLSINKLSEPKITKLISLLTKISNNIPTKKETASRTSKSYYFRDINHKEFLELVKSGKLNHFLITPNLKDELAKSNGTLSVCFLHSKIVALNATLEKSNLILLNNSLNREIASQISSFFSK